jgi:hypothetical protein
MLCQDNPLYSKVCIFSRNIQTLLQSGVSDVLLDTMTVNTNPKVQSSDVAQETGYAQSLSTVFQDLDKQNVEFSTT